jgi:hypothetical protein
MKKIQAGSALNHSRRKFIVGSAAASGGLALGFHLPLGTNPGIRAVAAQGAAAGNELNAWVVVQPDDTCLIRIARAEMGQGTHTGLAQLVAEELECDWKKVTIEQICRPELRSVWRTCRWRTGIAPDLSARRCGGCIMLVQAQPRVAGASWRDYRGQQDHYACGLGRRLRKVAAAPALPAGFRASARIRMKCQQTAPPGPTKVKARRSDRRSCRMLATGKAVP